MDLFYWIWGLLWALFYGLHSALASQRVKSWVHAKLPYLEDGYRLFYNLLHLALFAGICVYGFFAESLYVFNPHWMYTLTGAGFCLWGAIVGIAAFRTFDTGDFLFGKESKSPAGLIESGWYSRVRHPLYFALLLLLAGLFFLWPTLKMGVFILVTCLYLPAGMYWEERKLIQQFGTPYRNYMKRTPQIIPRIWS